MGALHKKIEALDAPGGMKILRVVETPEAGELFDVAVSQNSEGTFINSVFGPWLVMHGDEHLVADALVRAAAMLRRRA